MLLLLLLRAFRVITGVACFALSVVVGVMGGLVFIKISEFKTMMSAKWSVPPTPVTTASVTEDAWEPILPAVGSLSAVQGVIVSAQLDGNVMAVSFAPGSTVKAGDLLVQQDVTSEEAQYRAAKAAAELARLNRDRSHQLLAKATISQQQFDTDDAAFKQAAAQAHEYPGDDRQGRRSARPSPDAWGSAWSILARR